MGGAYKWHVVVFLLRPYIFSSMIFQIFGGQVRCKRIWELCTVEEVIKVMENIVPQSWWSGDKWY